MKIKNLILLGTMHKYFSMMQTSNNHEPITSENQVLDGQQHQGVNNAVDLMQQQMQAAMLMQQNAMEMSRKQQEDIQRMLQNANCAAVDDMAGDNNSDALNNDSNMGANLKAEVQGKLNEAKEASKEEVKERAKDALTDCVSDICVIM